LPAATGYTTEPTLDEGAIFSKRRRMTEVRHAIEGKAMKLERESIVQPAR
jgi:hypothetical protein